MKAGSPRLGVDDDSLWFGRIYFAVWILHGSYCDMGIVLTQWKHQILFLVLVAVDYLRLCGSLHC